MRKLPITTQLPRQPSAVCQQVFQLLLDVNQSRQLGATLRVAGGWVRDSLMGREANDVDIAIETPAFSNGNGAALAAAEQDGSGPTLITGKLFAEHIAAFQREKSQEPSSFSVVKVNPDKSKHIETAQMTLFGLPVEFCHLRADDYSAQSRIPLIRPGTPLEDAQRRDFTVNALYYNLHTQQVEDYTTGLEDMQQAVLRCPLDPLETFLDDPLRLLRGVRFAGQLGYRLDDSILACVQHNGVSKLIPILQQKLSRERIGIEVTKMFGGWNPSICIGLLHQTQLMYSTLLVEHYYIKSKGGKTTIGGPSKSETVPTRVEYTLASPELARAAGATEVPALSEDFQRTSAEVFRRGTIWLKELDHFARRQLGDEHRMKCSFYSFLPMLLEGHSFPDTVFQGEDKPKHEIQKYRVQAILTHAMKLPVRIGTGLSAMMRAGDFIAPRWTELVGDIETHRESNSTSSMVFQGCRREAMFFAMKALLDEPNASELLQFVIGMQCLQHYGEAGWKTAFDAFVRALDTDKELVSLVGAPARIKGNLLQKELGVENKKLGHVLELQQWYLIHNPTASEEEIVAFLRGRLSQE